MSPGTPSISLFALCLKCMSSANVGRCWEIHASFSSHGNHKGPIVLPWATLARHLPLITGARRHLKIHSSRNASRSVKTSLHMLLQLRVVRPSSHVLLSCRLRPVRSNPHAGSCAGITDAVKNSDAFQSTSRSNYDHATTLAKAVAKEFPGRRREEGR